jgi:hypothetical protein
VVRSQDVDFKRELGVAPGDVNGRNTGEMIHMRRTEIVDDSANLVRGTNVKKVVLYPRFLPRDVIAWSDYGYL